MRRLLGALFMRAARTPGLSPPRAKPRITSVIRFARPLGGPSPQGQSARPEPRSARSNSSARGRRPLR